MCPPAVISSTSLNQLITPQYTYNQNSLPILSQQTKGTKKEHKKNKGQICRKTKNRRRHHRHVAFTRRPDQRLDLEVM